MEDHLRVRFDGFFDELHYGQTNQGSIVKVVANSPHPDQENIISYLEGGTTIMVAPVVAVDILDPELPFMGDGLKLFSDGEWIWPNDLVEYVTRHNVRISEDFISRMREMLWKCPVLSPHEVDMVMREVAEHYMSMSGDKQKIRKMEKGVL